MTESTCLHIQDRESGPIRVVDLPWTSVRIGRAPHCEVRLTRHDLADEICRLQRRGHSWRLMPNSIECPIFLQDRRLGGSCFLPFDVPFRIGEYCFTLRRDRAAEPDWEMYAGPAPPRLDPSQQPPVADEEPEPEKPLKTIVEPPTGEPPVPRYTGFSAQDSRERWETRWKALGAQVKARAASNRQGGDLKRPAYESDLKPVPVREPRVPQFQPPLPSSIGQAAAPVRTFDPARSVPANSGPDIGVPTSDALIPDSFPLPPGVASGESLSANSAPDDPAYTSDAEFSHSLPLPPEEVSGEAVSANSAPDDLVHTNDAEFSDPQPLPLGEVWDEGPTDLRTVNSQTCSQAKTAQAAEGVETVWEDETADRSVTNAVSEPSWRDEIAPERRAQILVSETECVDFEQGPGTPSEEIRVEEPHDEEPCVPGPSFDQPGAEDLGEADFPVMTRASSSPVREVEWPSAKDILAAYSASSSRPPATGGSKATRKKTGTLSTPTLAKAPACWAPPVWLAGPAAALFVVSTGLLGCVLSWSWAQDSYTAAMVTNRLLTSDRAIQRSALPESVDPPQGGWTVSTAGHLAHWAIFLARFAGEDKQSPAETIALLERALSASPINPTARLALAQLEPVENSADVSIRSLGLSRDAVSLAWTARRLLAAGRKDDALKLYGRALSVAVPAVPSRSPVPRFIEDPGIRRYLLPGEERVREIVVELTAQNAWTFDEWSAALPETATVLIATARLLREKGRSEAELVLDRLVENKAIGEAGPIALAARAEAFALRSRWKEADQLYRQAIDSIADPTIARSWWFNLAEISYRSDDESQRQAALRAASAVASSDDITRRAADIQRATLTRSTGVKAN